MDHLVCLDAEAKELERLAKGIKSMIVRSSAERKVPHGTVGDGDILYFVNEGESTVRARATVRKATSTTILDQEASILRMVQNQRKLKLTEQQFVRWAGRRYTVFVEVDNFEEVQPFDVSADVLSDPDGWAAVGDIAKVRGRTLVQ